MKGLAGMYPRIVLDIELYRPRTGRGRSGFFTGKLIAIGLGVQRSPSDARVEVLTVEDLGEAGLVRRTLEILEAEARSGRGVLGGYNILSLDLPVILSKAYTLLGDRWGRRAASTLYRRFLVVDMFQHALHSYEGEGLPSFRWFYQRLACSHGLPVPPKDSGYNVHELYEAGDMGRIVEYSRLDTALHLVALSALLGDPGTGRLAGILGVGGERAVC